MALAQIKQNDISFALIWNSDIAKNKMKRHTDDL
jgi:hypothetical protein